MSAITTLAILITADGKQAISEIGKVGSTAEKSLAAAGKGTDRFANSMLKAGAATTVAGAGILAGLNTAVDAAQALNDQQDRAASIFTGAAGQGVEQWASKAAGAFGLSETAALDAASAYGVLLKGVGVTGNKLAQEAQDLAGITVDVAERFTVDREQVKADFEKAVSGRKGADKLLLKYDIDLSPQKVNAEAVRLGIAKVGDELSRAQKAQAAVSIISQSSSRGFFSQQDDVGAQRAKQQAAAINALADAGAAAAPVLNKLTDAMTTVITTVSGNSFLKVGAEILAIGAAAGVVAGPLLTLGGLLLKAGKFAVSKIGTAAADTADAVAANGAAAANTRLAAAQAEAAASAQGLAAAEGEATIAANGAGIAGASAMAKFTAAAGLATIAVIGFKSAWDGIQDIQSKEISSNLPTAGDIQKALDPGKFKGARGAFFAQLTPYVTGTKGIADATAPIDAFGHRVPVPGTGASPEEATRAATQKLVEAAKAALDPKAARQLVDDARKYLEDQGKFTEQQIVAFVGPASSAVDLMESQARRAAGAITDIGNAGRNASTPIGLLAAALQEVDDAAANNKVETLTDALDKQLGPLQGLISANDRLRAAQKAAADARKTDVQGIADAYDTLTDAKQRLNDALHPDDGTFGLSHQSAQQAIADAEKRLAEANTVLERSPDNAAAITKKDLAISDMEEAKKRQQEDLRNAKQQARTVDAARKDVDKAQKAYNDKLKNSGPNSDAIKNADAAVAAAQWDRAKAEATFAQWAKDSGLSLDQINQQLADLAAKGLIPPDLFKELQNGLRDGGQHALDFARKLDEAAGILGRTIDKVGATNPLPAPPQGAAGKSGDQQPAGAFKPIPGAIPNRKPLSPSDAYALGFPQFAGEHEQHYFGGVWWEWNKGGTHQWVPHYAQGGLVSDGMNRGLQSWGGSVKGSGIGDVIDAKLDPREYVLRPAAVAMYGIDHLNAMNALQAPVKKFADGGLVGAPALMGPRSYTSSSSSNATTVDQRAVTFKVTNVMTVPDPSRAGEAVESRLRAIAHRSGTGVRVG